MKYLGILLLLITIPMQPLCAAVVEDAQPSLGPKPRMNPLRPDNVGVDRIKTTNPTAEIDHSLLSQDVSKIMTAAEQLRMALLHNKIAGLEKTIEEKEREEEQEKALAQRQKKGTKPSSRMGANLLEATEYTDGSWEVTAAIEREKIGLVYEELLYLIGWRADSSLVDDRSVEVYVNIENMPWQDALTRILGQAGLTWSVEMADNERGEQIIKIFPQGSHPDSANQKSFERLAQEALNKAAANGSDSVAAEALLLRAERERKLGHARAAIDLFLDVQTRFPQHKEWVLKAVLGTAQTFNERNRYREARTWYLNYIAGAEEADPLMPRIYRLAAQASFDHHKHNNDLAAVDKAMQVLDDLISKFGQKPAARGEVIQAKHMMGRALFEKGEFATAKKYLLEFQAGQEEARNDLLRYSVGECFYQIGLQDRDELHFDNADENIKQAISYFTELVRAVKTRSQDPTVPESLYHDAWNRLGDCHMQLSEPRFVEALNAFLGAKRRFQSAQKLSTIIHIAHCYRELESSDASIAQMSNLLRSEGFNDAQEEIGKLLQGIEGSLASYSSPAKAKVLFYIAQAHYRAAERDRLQQDRYHDAIRMYQRVLDVLPSRYKELTISAQLGQARAALRVDEDRAEAILAGLLRNKDVQGRDREYAAQMLGRFYQSKQRWQDAIQAFDGMRTE